MQHAMIRHAIIIAIVAGDAGHADILSRTITAAAFRQDAMPRLFSPCFFSLCRHARFFASRHAMPRHAADAALLIFSP